MSDYELQRYVSLFLQHSDFEDLLEEFDLTPEDVFVILYDVGYIDEERLQEVISV